MKSIFHAISSAILDHTRCSETAGQLARKTKLPRLLSFSLKSHGDEVGELP